MNSDEFYGLVPGAIGELRYMARTSAPTEESIMDIQSQLSSSMFSSYLANYQFTKGGGQDMDPLTAFTAARKRALEEAEKLACAPTEMIIHVEIGQEESIRKMLELETSDRFIEWCDANLANLIKTTA